MRFAVALLALASAVAAQTVGFDVVQKPTENESVPAGAAYTIEWTPSPQDKGTVSLTLLAGSSPQSLQVLELLKAGVDSTDGKYSWNVPSTLAANSVYGIKISLDADPSTFQYSFPFRIVGGMPGKAAATTAASATAAATSTSASSTKLSSTSSSTSSVSSSLTSSSTSTTASTTAVAPVSSAPPASSVQTHHKASTLVTSTKTATGTSTGHTTAPVVTSTATATSTTATASSSSTASATPSAIKTSGGVAGKTVSLATLLCGLAIAYAAL